MNRTVPRRLLAALVGILAALMLTLIGAGAASAQATTSTTTNPSGFIRLAHLAPEVGPVDVYLAPFGGAEQSVITKAPYGSLTHYQTLAPGDYTIAMRPAGTPATSASMLSAQLTVTGGVAYTVLAKATMGALTTSVINDDLTPPPADMSRVRLVQGSTKAQDLTVEAVSGPILARGLAYGTATGYGDVPQGRWTLKVTAPDGSSAMASAPVVDLAAGSVNSLLVTDASNGGFTVTRVVDAAGIDHAMAPTGGVETGGGGTATSIVDTTSGLTVRVAGPGLLLAAAVGLGLLPAAACGVLPRRRTVAVRA